MKLLDSAVEDFGPVPSFQAFPLAETLRIIVKKIKLPARVSTLDSLRVWRSRFDLGSTVFSSRDTPYSVCAFQPASFFL